MFWVPGGLPTRVKVVGLISGRDTYRPPEFLQRSILRKDPSRAYRRRFTSRPRSPNFVSSGREKTVGDSPRDFARFVLRRAALAVERMELRLLGPEYKSPHLITDELLASSRFVEGLEKIPGPAPSRPEKMLNELATGWSRFSVDLIPNLGRAIFSRGFDPESTTTQEIESMRRSLRTTRRCCSGRTGPTSTA